MGGVGAAPPGCKAGRKKGALAAKPPERLLRHSGYDRKNNYLAVHPSSNPPPPTRLARGFMD